MNAMTDSASPTVAEAFPLVKTCTKCGVEKLLVDFSLDKSRKFGRHSQCKVCICAHQRRPEHRARQRARQQRPEVREYQRAYLRRPEVKERRRAYQQRQDASEQRRIYKQSPEYKEWLRTYQRHRRRNDPAFKIAGNLRNRLFCALQGHSKSARTLELIGCDIDFLRRWLEAKFLPGMTWENYGEWHVDHIMPCASFDLSDPVQQRTCFRWTNLQPLWAADNIRKSDNYAS